MENEEERDPRKIVYACIGCAFSNKQGYCRILKSVYKYKKCHFKKEKGVMNGIY